MKILIATKNKGKFGEIKEGLGLDFEVDFLGDRLIDDSDFVEDGTTHEENARKKAKYYFERVGDGFDFVIGEDSGIYVDALKDELGVQTRRWGAGDAALDEEWLEYFMKEMKVRAPARDQRGAKFVCCACVVGRVGAAGSGTLTRLFKGETLGVITDSVMAPILPGLPLSSVFLPKGFDKVYAALSREEKNKISHRGQAVGKVREWLKNL